MTKAAPKAGAKAGSKAGAGKFAKGASGNPAGMKRGTKHRRTLLLAAMTDDDRAAIVEKIIRQAKRGDRASQKLIVDRIEPQRRGSPVALPLPKIETTADTVAAMAAVLEAMSTGKISATEALELSAAIGEMRKTIELEVIRAELRALEKQVTGS